MVKQQSTFQSAFRTLRGVCMVVLLVLIAVFFAPKMKFYYNELPQLEVFETEEGCDVTARLPDAFDQEMILCFWSNHQTLKAFLESEEVYSTAEEGQNPFGKLAASRWNRIKIPACSAGKELRIHSETGTLPFVREYVYGTNEQINQWIHQHYGVMQLIDNGLIGVGALFILFGIFGRRDSVIRERPLYLGEAMVLLGLLFRVSFKGIPLYWMNDYAKDFVGYFTFFAATVPLLFYISKKRKTTGIYADLYQLGALLQMLLVVLVFALHGAGIKDISEFLWMGIAFWIFFILLAFFGAVVVLLKERNKLAMVDLTSASILIVMVPLEILRYYFWSDNIKEYGTLLRICLMAMISLEVFSYSINIQIMEVQKERTEEENKKLQFQLLSSQIRPHFILNTLGAIRSMITVDADKASDLLYDFSMYLRKNIEEKDYMKPIPFGEELDYIETYLRLEQTRFGDRLKVNYRIEEKEFRVLPLTIQPFVENAVKHGLFPKKNGGTLEISVSKKEEGIVIEIRDDGVGFETEKLPSILIGKKSVGLQSAIGRIESEMRGTCRIISREQGEEGTLVRVILPL